MTNLKAEFQDPPSEFGRLGGRGLSSHIIYSEVPATCHPLGKDNRLILAPGLLAGSAAPSSGRLSVGAKSPLTGGIKEANVGGTPGHKMARLGLKAIILEGQPARDSLYLIKINKEGVTILPAPELKGLGNYATAQRLLHEHGDKAGIICIGPAGETRLAAASVACTDPQGRPARHAARGGMGAVMGSKGIKAIIIDDEGTEGLEARDKKAFRDTCQAFVREILERKATSLLSQFGTIGGLVWLSKWGSLPTRNFTCGTFEGDSAIGGKGVAEVNASRGGSFGQVCMPGCVVRCSNTIHDKDGHFVTAGFEFESGAMLGSNLGIDNRDDLFALERMCDDLGLDTIEIGGALGVAADAGLYTFGDSQRALALLQEVGQGTPPGPGVGAGGCGHRPHLRHQPGASGKGAGHARP